MTTTSIAIGFLTWAAWATWAVLFSSRSFHWPHTILFFIIFVGGAVAIGSLLP